MRLTREDVPRNVRPSAPAALAAACAARPGLEDLPEALLHHVMSMLQPLDTLRLRSVSRGLAGAVRTLPGGLFVKLSIVPPDASLDAEWDWPTSSKQLFTLRAYAWKCQAEYLASVRSTSHLTQHGQSAWDMLNLDFLRQEVARSAQAAELAAGRLRERSFRAFIEGGGATAVTALDLNIQPFAELRPLNWPPLSNLRQLVIKTGCMGHPRLLMVQELCHFYTVVERLVDGAPMLEELWVFVPGYAHHHQLFRRTTPRSMKSA